MSFKDIDSKIKPRYMSAKCNLVDDFYNIILSQSNKYDRISGFFNSDSLAAAAMGMSKFILKKGHMRLLCSAKLDEKDVDSINDAYDLKNIISSKFVDEFDNIEDELTYNHVKMLGWMIAKEYLEIKIGVNLDEDGNYGEGIVHPKIGILYDELNDVVSFDGSVNETRAGWLKNTESLKVFKSWTTSEYMEEDIEDFDELWYNNMDSVEVFDIPDVPKKVLVNNAPNSEEEFLKLVSTIDDEIKKLVGKSKPKLRDYQNDALKSWINNNYKGIFSMATGTGKTYTAISCFDRLIHKKNNLLTVIACPQLHLITQWEESIKKFKYKGKIIIASGDNKNWKKEVMAVIADLMGSKKNAVILTTFDTFSNEDFINIINLHSYDSFLIVDEVHGIGAQKYRQGFLNVDYDYRLGLSATPEIKDDLERTDLVYDYFGGVIYEYDLKKAIDNGFLTPYYYCPIFVDLTNEELDKYKYYSSKIARLLGKANLKPSEEESLDKYIRKRRNLINKAKNKLTSFKNFLDDHEDIKDLIVYCADKKHLKEIKSILDEHDISNHQFTGEEKTKKNGGKSEKDLILELFVEGHYRALCAMKCLDEGVDIPSTKNAVLMASTLNSRQHIQRRGRILRKSPGKECAVIYDFIVVPNLKNESQSVKNILDSERRRYEEYANAAKNRTDCLIKIAEKWEEIL